ncbi:MAG: very short patch repair endonuclease [Acidobacteriota bacterium]
MTDTFTEQERSRVMRSVKSRGNVSTELKAVRLFRENKITGWRRHQPLAGKPDFIFPKKRLAIFIDGCFWHGHDCRNLTPAQNADYWRAKIKRNVERDARVTKELEAKGWRVLRVWECELKQPERFVSRLADLLQCVSSI